MKQWSTSSWLSCRYEQALEYPDPSQLNKVVSTIAQLPPLVSKEEVDLLKRRIAEAGRGEVFILQGGDCAESFNDCQPNIISNKLKILFQMSYILNHHFQQPIIKIGRIAGQYTKPRSSLFETKNNITLPSYRGDLVNLADFTLEARTHNPELLQKGYHYAAMTLNFIRSLLSNSHYPQTWKNELSQRYLNNYVLDTPCLNDFFTSHEALHLYYEQALTHQVQKDEWYDLSTHLPWLGIRTGHLDGAHLEFLRGVQNPIGIKIGPDARCEWLQEIVNILNPKKEEGRILLITRLGINHISNLLPDYIEAVRKTKIPVTWSCDPMHGNTEMTEEGYKTRHFDNILKELELTVTIHQTLKSYLGGVHFELTGDNVTECLGGTGGITEVDLKHAYHSLVDPRLNYQQSLEMAFRLGENSIKKLRYSFI